MCAFFDQLVYSEPDLDQAIAAVAQMSYRIALQALFGAEMVYAAIQCLRINAEVANTKRFKQQTAGSQIVDQISGADAQRGGRNRRIDEIAGVGCADRRF